MRRVCVQEKLDVAVAFVLEAGDSAGASIRASCDNMRCVIEVTWNGVGASFCVGRGNIPFVAGLKQSTLSEWASFMRVPLEVHPRLAVLVTRPSHDRLQHLRVSVGIERVLLIVTET